MGSVVQREQRLSEESYNALLNGWNKLRPPRRRERAAKCDHDGHRYVEVWYSQPGDREFICRVCCTRYRTK